ncbi:glutamyl-tRNA reductase [Sporolactobacillus pectinivorans]|uniref:glutamyl-tRNA reductase n=1 Tax=Sporolactobacillus pectinivorans TaxID=1591408 RepID=UPI000C25E4B5|nr:glutamyl-tRNA reductase [Sporolactobacillus pectinivorans]
MHILAIGVNFRGAPIKIREKLTFEPSDLEKALKELHKTKGIFENVIVSTCNRTEIYAVSDRTDTGCYAVKHFFTNWFHVTMEELLPLLLVKEDKEAVDHLFHVTCGLDSMILGETQILGQVRSGFLTAQKSGATGAFFNELFKEALTVAKRAQSETHINDHPVSVSYAAVEMVKNTFGPLENKRALIVGAGEMGELALKHLSGAGTRDIMITNRTKSKADQLAKRPGLRSVPFELLNRLIEEADIVICTTSAQSFLISGSAVFDAQIRRRKRPLILVDICVPRNIDPAAGKIAGVFLYDIDDFEKIIDHNHEARRQAAQEIEPLIDHQLVKFNEWLLMRGVAPVISALRKKALTIHSETMKSIEHKLPGMTEQEHEIIRKHAQSMINQLLHDPINKLKELAGSENGESAVDLFADFFNIVEDESKRNNSAWAPAWKNNWTDEASVHEPPTATEIASARLLHITQRMPFSGSREKDEKWISVNQLQPIKRQSL